MSSRINWGPITGSDTCGYSFIQGRYAIWLRMLKCVAEFRIVLYSDEVIDIKVSAAFDEGISIYDDERCNSVEQAMQICEDALSEILRGYDNRPVVNDGHYNAMSIQVMMKNLIAAQDALIDKMSNNLAIDVDDPECTDPYKQEAIYKIRDLVSQRDTWRGALNALENAIRKDK